mgnify:CR=1 FL=1
MKKFMAILILVSSLQAFGFAVLTDLDDTIKMTNVQNARAAIRNGLILF